VSLDITPGEFITLLGPSGSGKTTTLMMIAGFHMPSSGEIFIGERPVTYLPPHQRNIGVVFQNFALFPHMTVSENIGFPLRMRHLREAEIRDKVAAALDLVGLPGYGTRYPKQLSGGQQQRVALARAIVFNPPVLLMDEALGSLDRKLRERMQLEIKSLHQTLGITIIHVTHDQAEALTMSDRVAVMNGGMIEQVGTPQDLYEHPANRFVADFVGESNFMTASVRGNTESMHLLTIAGQLDCLVPRMDHVRPGDNVHLVVRPERILLGQEVGSTPNRYEGQVQDIIYTGDVIKYRIALSGQVVIMATLQNRGPVTAFKRGEVIQVGWSPEDVRVFISPTEG
jgi:spermidine/putrescine ABC transporter ATP-binding subunit